MCSYNAVNGVPSCANNWLLGTLLRDSWAFDGYVTSDCDADSDVFFSHNYTKTPSEAVAVILRAGTDVDCGYDDGFMKDYAPGALADGSISIEDIDTVITRLYKVRIRLGTFDPPTPQSSICISDDVCTLDAIELARDGARQGIVLVKNTQNTLPLTAANYSSPIVIGPNIYLSDIKSYYGPSIPCNNSNWVPLDAIKQHIAAAYGIEGVPSVSSTDVSGVPAAAAAAALADVVFLAIGSDLELEREANDRKSIALSDAQLTLISAVTAAANGPVIAIVQSGGAMDITPLLVNPKIKAILVCGQPSIQIVAAGDIIFGKTLDGRTVSPAARMSQMTYPASYVDEVSEFEFSLRPGVSAWPPGTTPGRTYRFYTGNAVLPFGFGLSYTSWTYTPIPHASPLMNLAAITAATVAQAATGVVGHIAATLKETAAEFYINVTNTGNVDSDDVVLGFLIPPGAGVNGVPLKELFGFERVFVRAGETVTVYLGAQAVRFTQADVKGTRHALGGQYMIRFGIKETNVSGLNMGYAETTFNMI